MLLLNTVCSLGVAHQALLSTLNKSFGRPPKHGMSVYFVASIMRSMHLLRGSIASPNGSQNQAKPWRSTHHLINSVLPQHIIQRCCSHVWSANTACTSQPVVLSLRSACAFSLKGFELFSALAENSLIDNSAGALRCGALRDAALSSLHNYIAQPKRDIFMRGTQHIASSLFCHAVNR